MSFTDRAAATAARLVGHFRGANDLTISRSGQYDYNADGSVDFVPDSYSVACTLSAPLGRLDKDLTRRGICTVWIDSSDPAISFDPEPGHMAVLADEQYRIARVDKFPGVIQVDLEGASPGGEESA